MLVRAALRNVRELPRDVKVLALTGGLVLLADELWFQYLPRYLEVLGASAIVVGYFGTLSNVLDAAYPYPGGWLSDRVRARRALVLFTLLAAAGFAVYALAPSWEWVFVGLFLATAWDTLARPAAASLVKEAMPQGQVAAGMAWSELPRRAAFSVGPLFGAGLIALLGFMTGMRWALWLSAGLALVAALIQHRLYRRDRVDVGAPSLVRWRDVPETTRRLLYADTLVRFGNGMIYTFVILLLVSARGLAEWQFGVLVAIEMAVGTLALVPGGILGDKLGHKPAVLASFAGYALFPLLLTWADSWWWLVLVFVLGGLRRVGDGPHKALVVAEAAEGARAGVHGFYFTVRNAIVIPSAALGGYLFTAKPELAFWVASGVAAAGVLLFAMLGYEPRRPTQQ